MPTKTKKIEVVFRMNESEVVFNIDNWKWNQDACDDMNALHGEDLTHSVIDALTYSIKNNLTEFVIKETLRRLIESEKNK